MYQVIHLSAECFPVAKVGGLGDVAGALPKYLNQAGVTSCVVMPRYNLKWNAAHTSVSVYEGNCGNENYHFNFHIVKAQQDTLGFDLYMVDIPHILYRDQVYGYNDDPLRFIYYQQAVLQWLCSWEQKPSVLHAHDHHCGYAAFMAQHCYDFHPLRGIKTVFTIHNGLYTAPVGHDFARFFPHFPKEVVGLLEWDYRLDPLATALKCSDRISTVSEGYLQELQQQASAYSWLYQAYAYKSYGILNGIDTQVWDPKTDAYLQIKLSNEDWPRFKQQHKESVCARYGFDPSLPLCVFIGRLTPEKGGDLIAPSVGEFVHQSKGMNFFLLGSGSSHTENELRHISGVFPAHVANYIGYNEGLAHEMYAAADFILMPSLVEPCGLNQMYALRYGTIPIVRSVGGLKDSVKDFGEYEGYGIRFNQASVGDIIYSFYRAKDLYHSPATFSHVRSLGIKLDFSWEKAVKKYIWLYQN
jgi:starch synthase